MCIKLSEYSGQLLERTRERACDNIYPQSYFSKWKVSLKFKMERRKPKKTLTDDYFLPRDFEIVQPIYDLAFLLKINGSHKKSSVPKYRVFSLKTAAHSLDGYSSVICKWLNGDFGDNDLDYVPSARIRELLTSIRDTGTFEELKGLLSPGVEACLRLRSIRGIGSSLLGEFLKKGANPSDELLTVSAKRSGIPQDEILALFQGRLHRQWQAPHVVPPLLRFLKWVEDLSGRRHKWKIIGIKDGISPVKDGFKVYMLSENIESAYKFFKQAVQKDPFFTLKEHFEQYFVIQHQMGWLFEISSKGNAVNGRYLEELISDLDPLASDLPNFLKSDLHIHTTWSDGIALPVAMAEAAAKKGLEYIAVTEHSRSSKLQRGLTPSSWLRQAMSISRLRRKRQLLHGMEVDILHGGDLDMPQGILCGMDLVVASVHSNWTGSEESNTIRIIKAIESGYVDVIGHPTSALLGRPGEPAYVRPPVKLDWDSVFECCSKWHVALEINCFPSRLDLSPELTKKAVEAGCWISLGTDSHSRFHMDVLKFGVEICNKARVHNNILNSLSFTEMREWLSEARKIRNQRSRTKRNEMQTEMFALQQPHSKKRSALIARLNERPRVPEGSTVVGIDLTDGKTKKTGVALLSGMNVETTSLLTDEELLQYIKERRPAIVSIDSPLGLPGGGKDIIPEAGIVRVAERHLSSVGIPSYPALINSMEGLTLRGIRLRKMIESLDEPPVVIESYPGAAQDLLCIPRKQRGLSLLREGLRELGLRGQGLSTKSHDEMDAITSAIVGRFYEAGQYEPMGIQSEAQLVVPVTPVLTFDTFPIICIAGKTGSGKSVVSRYLALYYGFKWIKTREIIHDLIAEDFGGISSQRLKLKKDTPVEESHLRDFGNIIMEEYNQDPLRERLTNQISKIKGAVVVDSIRSPEDLDASYLEDREIFNWYVYCPDSIIRDRWVNSKGRDRNDLLPYEDIDRNADAMKEHADSFLSNDGTLENLYRTIDDTLFSQVVKVAIRD